MARLYSSFHHQRHAFACKHKHVLRLVVSNCAAAEAYGMSVVTLGSSELKVSKIILGCALYGSPDWLSRVQNEEESIKQIKAAYMPIPLCP